ncbi:MAG TPA: lactonase family protein [Candidatus Atribacteria bacterium]|nr:lactonase family protein [Candidatus Atribacteria bacterium]
MAQKVLVYVGTYTSPIKFGTGEILEGKGEGIYVLELNLDTGKLEPKETVTGVLNPSYLVLNGPNSCLYAVNELKEFEGKVSGSVSGFRVSQDGVPAFINKQATGGSDPCFIEVNASGTYLYVCNFMSGSVCVFPIGADGAVEPYSQFIQHEGSSVNPARQSGPHPHSFLFSPDGRYALIPDLGLDKVVIYQVDRQTQLLNEASVSYFSTSPGAGPRHITFDPEGRFMYLINELHSTVVALEYHPENGSLTELQTVSSLPPGVEAAHNTGADIHITPDGVYLYASNRGHDSLACYRVDQKSGLLSYVSCQPSGGKTPRNFALDPTGRYLLCANQDSDNIIVFEINYRTGELREKSRTTIPTPVCVKPYLF